MRRDPNPIIDEGAPTSTGGTIEAAALCDMMAIPFEVHRPRAEYLHGWGTDCAGARPIKCTWHVTVMDTCGWPVTFEFDLVEGNSPLIIGLDLKRYSDTCNRSTPRTITFKRPNDVRVYTMYTYIEDDYTGCARLRMELVPHTKSIMRSMMTPTDKRRELTMAKRVYRFGHASVNYMVCLMKPTGYDIGKIKEACAKVYNACSICAASGRPADRKKVSTTHINAAFNDELQADFCYVHIRGQKYEVLNMIDMGTRYGERALTTSRTAEEVKRTFEVYWFYKHGAPKHFSADHELCRPVLERFLNAHQIQLNPRPSRSSHKSGRVERNNGLFKAIVERLQKADGKAKAETIVARASFVTNLIRGSKVMSSYQLARGYSPSVLGIPSQVVSQDILDAYVERESTRALEKIMRAKDNTTIEPEQLATGTDVYVFYKSSKHNEPNEWVPATVINARADMVICKRRSRGPPMTVSYSDIRMMPRGQLTQDLMQMELEDNEEENIVRMGTG